VHNFDSKPREIRLSAGVDDERGNRLIDLLAHNHCEADEKGRHHLLLRAYDYRWYRVGGLDYLLERSDIDLQQQQPQRG
jgi:maltose alpha-D-glucosyltransferase/alpha-amylase